MTSSVSGTSSSCSVGKTTGQASLFQPGGPCTLYQLSSYLFLVAGVLVKENGGGGGSSSSKQRGQYDVKLLTEADTYLKEVLTMDIHDKLSARHNKKLLVQLARQGSPGHRNSSGAVDNSVNSADDDNQELH